MVQLNVYQQIKSEALLMCSSRMEPLTVEFLQSHLQYIYSTWGWCIKVPGPDETAAPELLSEDTKDAIPAV